MPMDSNLTSKSPDGGRLSEQTAVAESFADTNPAVWVRLQQGTEGKFTDEAGLLWTYKRVAPWRGKGFYFSPEENEPTIDNDYFFLVSKTSVEDVHKEVLREMKGSFFSPLYFYLLPELECGSGSVSRTDHSTSDGA